MEMGTARIVIGMRMAHDLEEATVRHRKTVALMTAKTRVFAIGFVRCMHSFLAQADRGVFATDHRPGPNIARPPAMAAANRHTSGSSSALRICEISNDEIILSGWPV